MLEMAKDGERHQVSQLDQTGSTRIQKNWDLSIVPGFAIGVAAMLELTCQGLKPLLSAGLIKQHKPSLMVIELGMATL